MSEVQIKAFHAALNSLQEELDTGVITDDEYLRAVAVAAIKARELSK